MSYVIGKAFRFSASHRLDGLPDGHQCARLHGHNYTVWLELEAPTLDSTGMVFDFGSLATFRTYIGARLDHRHLNDELDEQPTAENVARHLFVVAEKLVQANVSAVTVWETETCWASYRHP